MESKRSLDPFVTWVAYNGEVVTDKLISAQMGIHLIFTGKQ